MRLFVQLTDRWKSVEEDINETEGLKIPVCSGQKWSKVQNMSNVNRFVWAWQIQQVFPLLPAIGSRWPLLRFLARLHRNLAEMAIISPYFPHFLASCSCRISKMITRTVS